MICELKLPLNEPKLEQEQIIAFFLEASHIALEENYIPKQELTWKNNKDKTISFYIAGNFFCKIKFTGKTHHLVFSKKYIHLFSGSKPVENYIRVSLWSLDDLQKMSSEIKEVCYSIAENITSEEFSFCSSWQKCSNLKRCVKGNEKDFSSKKEFLDNWRFYAGCSYRRKIKQGIILVGNNQNIGQEGVHAIETNFS